MVQFLREQNTQLWDELERLKKHQSKSGSAPTSTPSSWVQIDGLGGGQPAEEASLGSTTSVGDGGGPVRPMAKKGEPPRTPRGRSPTNRRPAAGGHRFTPNGTQVPPGSPPDRAALPEIPAPPFPPSSNSADLSSFWVAVDGMAIGCPWTSVRGKLLFHRIAPLSWNVKLKN